MRTHGEPWEVMGTHGYPWEHAGFHWYPWEPIVPMGAHTFPWVPMGMLQTWLLWIQQALQTRSSVQCRDGKGPGAWRSAWAPKWGQFGAPRGPKANSGKLFLGPRPKKGPQTLKKAPGF